MDVREKLVELLDIIIQPGQKTLGDIADHLIANGVTVQEWISVTERLPEVISKLKETEKMKEITQVATIELTYIERIKDDQMYDLERNKEDIRAYVKFLFARFDDVRTDVKFFVRDLDDMEEKQKYDKD